MAWVNKSKGIKEGYKQDLKSAMAHIPKTNKFVNKPAKKAVTGKALSDHFNRFNREKKDYTKR